MESAFTFLCHSILGCHSNYFTFFNVDGSFNVLLFGSHMVYQTLIRGFILASLTNTLFRQGDRLTRYFPANKPMMDFLIVRTSSFSCDG